MFWTIHGKYQTPVLFFSSLQYISHRKRIGKGYVLSSNTLEYMKYRVYENADWRDTLLMCSAKFLLQDDQGSKNAQLQSMCWFTVERGQCIYSCTQAGDLKS